ncbi:MAG TPA: ATP-dependent sacrificial sulfur transferase LarE [bacterium]|nr:ATP-dependent sacrificial sulfur transferase LarE [bacterium]
MNHDVKITDLEDRLRDMKRVLVAFSGGVDSTLLLRVAHEVLGENALAVTAVSDIHAPEEFSRARSVVREWGVKHFTLKTDELDDERFISNPENRCYFCKLKLFTMILSLAREKDIPVVLDGSNADDMHEIRPGMKALRELGIRSPLQEAGLTKPEIRAAARSMGLPIWNQPALACLASRIPFGRAITREKIQRVYRAESLLRDMGFQQVRVRDHSPIARIEVEKEDRIRLIQDPAASRVIREFRRLGFYYVTLDLEGYRSGSLHIAADANQNKKGG